MKRILLLLFLLSFSNIFAETNYHGNAVIKTYAQARRILPKIFFDRKITFYCDCAYSNRTILHDSCGYKIYKNKVRADRLEWEHIVPAHAFGWSFKEWREGHPQCKSSKGRFYKGRRCVQKVNKTFNLMEADMYNIMPSVGEINAMRSNYSFTIIENEKRQFGKCDFEILNRKVEPKENIRGDIARIYFYMDWAYPHHGIISKKNRKLFKAWDKLDPVDEWECLRNKRIQKYQKNINIFVIPKCK